MSRATAKRSGLGAGWAALVLGVAAVWSGPAQAADAVSCGGVAALGAAQIACSHVAPRLPAQLCTFSWALLRSTGGQQVVEGSFMLPPRASNVQVFQGSGYDRALSPPIVMCQAQ